MNIVINTVSLSKDDLPGLKIFVADCILQIINTHPGHSFFLITDGTETFGEVVNDATILAIAPKSKNILVWKIWYAYKLPAILKKYKAGVFINTDSICSLKTNVPQCILVPDCIGVEQVPFSKQHTRAFFEKAATMITFSNFAKNDIEKNFKIAEQKIVVVHTGAGENYLPIDETARDITKEKYTGGKEYFLFSGTINEENNLLNLLKAFSFFKKRQKSNMQLVIVTKAVSPENTFIKSLQSFKFKDDVKLLFNVQEAESARITAAAYAFVFATQNNNFYTPVLQAMQSRVPVIAANSILMKEICGDAALFTDPAVFENIADKMMLLFKDELTRNELIGKGKLQAAKYPLATTNELLWENIVKCAGISA